MAMLGPHMSAPFSVPAAQLPRSHLNSQQQLRWAERTLHLKRALPNYSAAHKSLAENVSSLELLRTGCLAC